jgi:hypothetical protein
VSWTYTPIGTSAGDVWGAANNSQLSTLFGAVNELDAGAGMVRVPWASGDRTSAIQTALNAAQTAGGGLVRLGPGNHSISAYLDVPPNVKLAGDSDRSTTITQTASNTPVVRLATGGNALSDLRITYSAAQSGTSAVAVELHNAFICRLERLHISNCYTGIGLAKGRGDTYLASCTVQDIEIYAYSGYALDLAAINNTSTGSYFANVYSHNNPSAGVRNLAVAGVRLANMSDSVVAVLNIEHSRHQDSSLIMSSCEGVNIIGLHLEGLEPITNFNALVGLYGSNTSVFLANTTVVGCFLTSTNIPNSIGIFKMDNGVRLAAHGVKQRSCTVSTPAFPILYGGADLTTALVWMWDVSTTQTTATLAGSTTNPYKWWNDRAPTLKIGTGSGTPGTLTNNAGALVWTSPAGTVTTIAPA